MTWHIQYIPPYFVHWHWCNKKKKKCKIHFTSFLERPSLSKDHLTNKFHCIYDMKILGPWWSFGQQVCGTVALWSKLNYPTFCSQYLFHDHPSMMTCVTCNVLVLTPLEIYCRFILVYWYSLEAGNPTVATSDAHAL